MTNDQALQILIDVTGQVNASREAHDKIKEALGVIQQAIQETKVTKE